ncbi:FeoC-like transcriptional regulator [Nocardioides sp. GY 10127]|uniref:FeoC-like transcriptional regulator n=1 Tax=Nocardioides sp. GY 10127 TaxID=2569762 RepID=UPI0010A8672C|nr:FeoC-like transcriptional regulator [Nocardioides sp. GY 10127]TIC84298.1 hypothetical protein E8D37_05855 [Nocardioides sp. GY 10127]
MSASPLRDVLAAVEGGTTSRAGIAATTGLRPDAVDAALDRLVSLGRLEARELTAGCPSSGCGSCASGNPDGGAGCGSAGPSAARRGPVLVELRLRRPAS